MWDIPASVERSRSGNGAHVWIPRFTSFRSATDQTIVQFYQALSKSNEHNDQSIQDVLSVLQEGRTPMILSERREHMLTLFEALCPHCKTVISMIGTASARESRETVDRLAFVLHDAPLVIVATGKYVGEGFDYPRLDTLFLALPVPWKDKVAQYAGRLHREYVGKNEVRIYDYVDFHVPMLERMYQKQLKGYASIGHHGESVKRSPSLMI